jgi:corrinoid protein of di/trimethylamine methyltransferase
MSEDILSKITASIVEGEPENTVSLTRRALESKLAPLTIINQGLVPGMNIAGEKFAKGEYFLPHLLIAAKGMQGAMELIEPELQAGGESLESVGTIVIGTVHGDIHEIGKSLVGTMLSANGFQVYDLGVDVSVTQFLDKALETNADLIGLSALLTTTMVVQRDVIEALEDAGMRDKVKVMVGGAPVNREWAEEIGADGYAEDAMRAVEIARELMEQ